MDSTVRNAEMTSDSSICAAKERRTPRGVAAADAACGDDAEARRAAEGELQKNEREREGVVDARHLLGGEHLSADDGVGQRVDLLQIIGKNNRRGVEQDNAPGLALGQLDRVRKGGKGCTETAGARIFLPHDEAPPGMEFLKTESLYADFEKKQEENRKI